VIPASNQDGRRAKNIKKGECCNWYVEVNKKGLSDISMGVYKYFYTD
jgi:hypothetical protein